MRSEGKRKSAPSDLKQGLGARASAKESKLGRHFIQRFSRGD